MSYVSVILTDEGLIRDVQELLDCIARAEWESKQVGGNYNKKRRAEREDNFGVTIRKVNTRVNKMLGEGG